MHDYDFDSASGFIAVYTLIAIVFRDRIIIMLLSFIIAILGFSADGRSLCFEHSHARIEGSVKDYLSSASVLGEFFEF